MSDSNVNICLMTYEHVNDVRQLLIDLYLVDEPLNRRLKFELPDEPQDFLDYTTQQAVRDKCSFVVIDNVTKKTIGFILNELKNRSDDHSGTGDDFQSKRLGYIFNMTSTLQQQLSHSLFDLLGVDRLLYTMVIAIDQQHRGQRLSEKLIESSLDYAKMCLHIRAAYTETSSLYSKKAFLKQNYKIVNELVYEQYDKQRLSDMGIHDRCSLVVKSW
jgi:ribosomal protein S18 acetylase RimI-like enzyme